MLEVMLWTNVYSIMRRAGNKWRCAAHVQSRETLDLVWQGLRAVIPGVVEHHSAQIPKVCYRDISYTDY